MKRLRSYRSLEGLTQEELGELLGVAPQAVSAAESGRRPLPASVLPTGYSEERFEVLPSMSEPLHRQRASTRIAAQKRAKELLRLGGEVYIELAKRQPRAPRPALPTLGSPQSYRDVEEDALEIRCGVLRQEELAPISNLTAAVERAGICLVPIVGLDGVDGLSSWVEGQPVIGLDPFRPGDRYRFSLAHELGHLVMHRAKSSVTEDEANRFAGALLVPAAELEAAFGDHPPVIRDFINMKRHWGVSVAALVYRSRELGLIDDRRYRSLQIQMSKWRASEPASFPAAHGRLLPKLVEVAGGPDQVALDLGMKADHVRELVNWTPLRVV